jgi:VWFA-related protein
MVRLVACLLFALVLVVPAIAQPEVKSPYSAELNSVEQIPPPEDKTGIYYSVKFTISLDGKDVNKVDGNWDLVVEENAKQVYRMPLPRPTTSADLTVMLAIDTSGSMKEHNRMPMARQATQTFLENLPKLADCGLVLFDHDIRKTMPPTLERQPILNEVLAIQPRGGTAFRDAAYKALQLFGEMPPGRDRAMVLMTDGADINSTRSLEDVIGVAKQLKVKVHTIGIGEPGKEEKVNTALVLDQSGSMELPANDIDLGTPKIKALHAAGAAFIHMMSEKTGRVSLIPFSSRVESPRRFLRKTEKMRTSATEEKTLTQLINELKPSGETALFDAVYTGILTLEADDKPGKRVVVAMTDGIDNSSRRRVGEVIDAAKTAGIKLYLLGFGREHEIDHATMRRMANETGGQYFPVADKDKLLEIFEKLSIELHDDGIDETSLKQIAKDTGGLYYHAKDVNKLQLILKEVSKSLEREAYQIDVASLNPRLDGTKSVFALRLVREGSTEPGIIADKIGVQRHGLIVAEMHPLVYLVLLMVLACLVAAPTLLRRPARGGA